MKKPGLTLNDLLAHLIAEWESEVIEFKRAGNDFNTSIIGEYFSALSNEANFRNAETAWLVFGVDDKTRSVVGTDYRPEKDRLQSLKMQIAQCAEPSITFRNIHEIITAQGRVVLFEIPPAPQGIPIAWKGHYFGRANESLIALGLDKLDEIRNQSNHSDWSAAVVPEATLDHLDPAALRRARDSFARKYTNKFDSELVESWSLTAFLDRARLTQEGKITRTALLLLGKPEAAHLLLPHPAQLTWKLEGPEKAYEHFGPPFLLSTTVLYQKIRNVQIRILPDGELLPVEVSKYDQKVVLEALHNCIAHQDYRRNGRIVVTEWPDKLTLENEGGFFEGKPDDYVSGTKTPRRYRNSFLAQAMTEINMIDTMGYGIHQMHLAQAQRFFPMPDFDLNETSAVCLSLPGSIVDPAYSRLLMQKTTLPLTDILALDRVQKRLPVEADALKRLRRAGLIEGHKPNLHVSALVADVTARKEDYILTRGQDDAFYAKLILDLLTKFGTASRQDIDRLLMKKLSDGLDPEQKRIKIGNLLTNLRRAGTITNTGSKRTPGWMLKAK